MWVHVLALLMPLGFKVSLLADWMGLGVGLPLLHPSFQELTFCCGLKTASDQRPRVHILRMSGSPPRWYLTICHSAVVLV